jgi:phosphatidylglycerol:prolipoprotein diacylglycerol transferase
VLALFPTRTIVAEFFGLTIYWYGLLYVAAWGVGALLLHRLLRYRQLLLTKDQRHSLLLAVMAGVLIGGRLGYILGYEPIYFWQHPGEILAVWQGGMSSHGGFLGVAVALWLCARYYKISLLALADVVVVPAALGLALGRLGNFINQELYGIPTSLPWGIFIPGVEGMRHPVQLYAAVKNIVIAVVCYWLLRQSRTPGVVTAVFLLLYGVGRFAVEYLRVQEYPLIMFGGSSITRGQFFTLPIIILTIFLFWYINKNRFRGYFDGKR